MTDRTAFADVGISWAEVTPVGLLEDPFAVDPTFQEWADAGPRLMALEQALPWIIGDWLLYGETKWGEMYAQAMDVTNYSYSRLSTFVYVCRAIPIGRRRDDLSFGHHEVVAPLEPDEQDAWLQIAASRKLSVHDLARAIAGEPTRDAGDAYWLAQGASSIARLMQEVGETRLRTLDLWDILVAVRRRLEVASGKGKPAGGSGA